MPEVIELDGLRLRGFMSDDVALVQSASADPYIPLITTVPTTAGTDEAQAFIERQLSRWSSGWGYVWAIARTEDDVAVGHLSLRLQGHTDGQASVGYWIGPEHRGRSYAAKAVRGLVVWTQSALEISRLELYAEPSNPASIRTAEAAGFVREDLRPAWELVGGEPRDMWMYALLIAR